MKELSFDDLFDNISNVNEDRIQGFYKDTYPDGYETRVNFQGFLVDQKQKGGQSNWRINHINRFFECAKLGKRLLRVPEEIWDEGENWMWCRFNMGKVTLNLKIADGGGMHRLITDYAQGKTKINYDLKDLLSEASETDVK